MNDEFKAIGDLNLDQIKLKLGHVQSGEGWSIQRCDAVEREYRRFLFLMKTYPDEVTAPTVDVDTFWHYHILDTAKYASDCAQAFGYFLHHYPYLGMDDASGEAEQQQAGTRLAELYAQHFGAQDEAQDAAWRGAATLATAWCGAANEATAWCGATKSAGAASAWCGAAKPAGAASAWCGAAKPAGAASAWCGAAKPAGAASAWCGAAKQASAATAWCGAAKQASAATAWCGRATKPAGAAAAWYGAAKPADAATAWCGASNQAKAAAARCGRAAAAMAA